MSMLMAEEEAAEAGRQVRERRERRDSPLPIHFNLNRERVFRGAIRGAVRAGSDADPGADY